MKRWRIYTPFVCRIVIERKRSRGMHAFDGLTEKEVIDTIKRNILYRWPAAELRDTTHFGHKAIDVSRDGKFYYVETDATPFLFHVALGS